MSIFIYLSIVISYALLNSICLFWLYIDADTRINTQIIEKRFIYEIKISIFSPKIIFCFNSVIY